MSLKPDLDQSCVNRLPPEIVAHIFSFFESSPPLFESFPSPRYRRKISHFRGVCQTWRGVSLEGGGYSTRGMRHLKGLLAMLESRTEAHREDRAVGKLYYANDGDDLSDLSEQTTLLSAGC